MNFFSSFGFCYSAPNKVAESVFHRTRKIFVFLFFFAIASQSIPSLAQNDEWIQKNNMSSAGAADRSRAVGISIGNYGYVGTGWDGTQNWDGWWRYDLATNAWTQMADFTTAPVTPGTARRECVAFSLGGFGYLGLGYDGSSVFQGLWKYDPGNNTWVYVGATGIPRYAAVSFVIGNKAYVTTGYDPPGSPAYKNDLWEFTPPTSWVQKTNFPGVARYQAMGFSIGMYGYVGGGTDGSGTEQKDFWQYNPQTNVWVQKASMPYARSLASSFSLKGKGYVVGGYDGSNYLDETLEYNPISNQWSVRANFGGGNRARAVGFSINGKGYVGTGTENGFNLFGDLWEYSPENISPVTFQKTYGGTNDDTDTSYLSFGSPTSDGGYVVTSTTKSFGMGGNDIYVIKSDPFGNAQWTRTFGTAADNTAASIQQTSDGGYIIAGNTRSAGNDDILILKINSVGTLIWGSGGGRTVTGATNTRANYAEETSGGYIITGTNGTGIALIKLTSTGATSIQTSISRTGATLMEGFSIEQTASGNFVIGGEFKATASSTDSYLMATNSTGGIVSGISYSYNSSFNGNDIRSTVRQTPDGGFIICGSTNTSGNGEDFFLIKTDNSATIIQWQKLYGGSLNDFGRALAVTSTGKYMVAGSTKSFGAGNDDAFLSCIDVNGNVLWTKTYGGTGIEKANSVYETADGGFVLFGESNSYGSGMQDVYVIKTDSLGNSGCNETNIPALPTTTISFARTGTNNTGAITVSNFTLTSNNTTTNESPLCLSCTFPIGIGTQNVSCFGACDGDAMVTAAGGAFPYTYLWSNGDTTDYIDSLCAGGYTVTVTDNIGCTAVDSIYINEPPELFVNLVQNSYTVCAGDSVTLTVSPSGGDSTGYYVYWYDSLGIISCDSFCNTTVVTPIGSGYIYVDVYDDSGCNAYDSVEIVVNPLPTIFAGNDDTICTSQNTTLTATGGASYVWSPSAGLSNPNISNPVASPSSTITYSVIGTDANGCTNTDAVKVNVVLSPTVAISTTSSGTVCEGTNVVLNAVSSPGSLLWSTSATTFSVSVTPTVTTVYSVTVTSANGCSAVATYTLNVNPRPWPSFATTDISCFGACDGKSTANPSAASQGPYTYSWNTSPVQTTQTASGLCDTTYTVFIVDANGCSAGGTDTISQPAVLDMTISSVDAACYCSGSATVDSAFGGTPPYNYVWFMSPVQTTSSITGLCAGDYSVTVTDSNGCTDMHSVTINQLPPIVVSVSPPDTICSGTTTTIGANVNGNAGITYTWFPGSIVGDTVAVAPAASTNYTVFATDSSSGCGGTGFVFVAVVQSPVVSISGNDTICSGGTASLTGSGTGNYWWSTGSNSTSIIVAPTITTIYSLTVTATSGNTSCSDVASFSVTVVSSPVINVSASSYTICSGLSSTTLTASGGNAYLWVPGPQANDTAIVSPDLTTTYTVYVSNASGCSGFSTITISVDTASSFPPPTLADTTFFYCIGDSILPVIASLPPPPSNIGWFDTAGNMLDTGIVFPPPQNLGLGTTTFYVVQGTTAACVSYPVTVLITINPLPFVDAGSDITVCSGHTAQLNATGGTTYLWSPSTFLNDSAIANPSSNPDSTFSYQVLVTDGNNCAETDSVTVFVSVSDTCGIHIYNVISPNGDDDNDVWWIDGINMFPDNFVEIFNRWGNSVWHGKNYDNRKVVWRGQNMQHQPLPAGTYYYVIDVKRLGRFSGWVELLR